MCSTDPSSVEILRQERLFDHEPGCQATPRGCSVKCVVGNGLGLGDGDANLGSNGAEILSRSSIGEVSGRDRGSEMDVSETVGSTGCARHVMSRVK